VIDFGRRGIGITALLGALCMSHSHSAIAQTKRIPNECIAISSAVIDGPAIDEKLLSQWEVALRCLGAVLDNLSPQLLVVNRTPTATAQYVRATGAIRILIANHEKEAIGKLREIFRPGDTFDVVSTLAYGARTEDQNSRLYSTLILGNVVDDSTVCVPIDHLYDSIRDDGRANLLAVVNVTAEWANRENYYNIERLHEYVTNQLRDRSDVPQTVAILQKIKDRLSQNHNKDSALTPPERQPCKKYRVRFDRSGLIRY
jgi:hypothetical protein